MLNIRPKKISVLPSAMEIELTNSLNY